MCQPTPFPANAVRRRRPEPVPGRPFVDVHIGDRVEIAGRRAGAELERGTVLTVVGDRATVQTARARVVVHPDRLRPSALVEEARP